VKERIRNIELPRVELPLKDAPVNVEIPFSIYDEENRLAMFLGSSKILSFARAQMHVVNFVKVNANLKSGKALRKRAPTSNIIGGSLLLAGVWL
jgi:hypothetical protein